MEFSSNYVRTMRVFSIPNNFPINCTGEEFRAGGCPVELIFKLRKSGAEVPPMLVDFAVAALHNTIELEENNYITVVVPLVLSSRDVRLCTGADTILKSFTTRYNRLSKTITPKGETYYGRPGIILDKDFKPLLYLTRTLVLTSNRYDMTNATVHIAPSIFLNDTDTLSKAILKKGVAYFLTHNIADWGWNDGPRAKVVIDDGSEFFRVPTVPSPTVDLKQEASALLKDNVAEVLGQLRNELRYF